MRTVCEIQKSDTGSKRAEFFLGRSVENRNKIVTFNDNVANVVHHITQLITTVLKSGTELRPIHSESLGYVRGSNKATIDFKMSQQDFRKYVLMMSRNSSLLQSAFRAVEAARGSGSFVPCFPVESI
jgi:hypothetical protein